MTEADMQDRTPLGAATPDERARLTREMFSAIAPHYDLLNHLLSLNIDRRWRRRAVDLLLEGAPPAGIYLDLCCGTFDLSIELARRDAGRVLAVDFSRAMLHQGRGKIDGLAVTPVCGDALRVPFRSDRFDGAMAAFGVRNLSDIDAGFRELARVLRPGGRLVVLDFALPERQPLKLLYRLYFTRLLPLVGRLVSKHSYAYTYLPESVLAFGEPVVLARRLEAAGFESVRWRGMTGGIACLWTGRRAETARSRMGSASGARPMP